VQSKEIATELMAVFWISNIFTKFNSSILFALTVLSLLPEIRNLPSAENEIQFTYSVCPSKVITSLPDSLHNNFIVFWPLLQAKYLPSGENATQLRS
jgi:hypothetical protein